MHMEVGFSLLQWWRLDLVCSEFGSCGGDKHGRGPRVFAVVPFFFCLFFIFIFLMYIGSHLLRVLWPLCSTGCVVQSYDGLVAHGANTANLQPFQQAPEKNSMRIS